jgi:hypothetical protein
MKNMAVFGLLEDIVMRMRRMKNLDSRMEKCAELRIAEPAALKGNWRSLKEDATALLKKHLTDKVDPVINAFTKKNNLNLTSYQHDALALFVYNYGSIPTALSEAVRTGKTGNQFINTIAYLERIF